MTVGDTLTVGTGGRKELLPVKRIVSVSAAPVGRGRGGFGGGGGGEVELSTPLKFDHLLGVNVSDAGTRHQLLASHAFPPCERRRGAGAGQRHHLGQPPGQRPRVRRARGQSSWPRRRVTKDRRRPISGSEAPSPPAPVRSPCWTPAASWSWTPWCSDPGKAVRARTGPSPVPSLPPSRATRARAAASWWRPARAEAAPGAALQPPARPTGAWAASRTAPTPTTTAPISICRPPRPAHPTRDLSKDACGRESDGSRSNRPGQQR